MKKFLLTFDVHEDHERIINELTANGWHSTIRGVYENTGLPGIGYLPETTWWIQANDIRVAYTEFVNIAGEENITRADIFEFSDWKGTDKNPLPHQIREIRVNDNNAA